MSALGIVIFALAILASIGLHEFGHFITAKKFGIKVEQFFIGFGPRLWSVRRGETEYGVKAFPVGGYVRIAGMNPFEEIPEEDKPRVFKSRPPWKRAIVLAAGSFTHFVLGLLIIAAVLATAGIERATTTVREVGKGSPAARAGVRPGDRLLAVDGTDVDRWQEAVALIEKRPGQQVGLTVERADRTVRLQAELAATKPDGSKGGFLGVAPRIERFRRGPVQAFGEAARQVGLMIGASLVAIKDLFSPDSIGRLISVALGNAERRVEDPATVIGIGGMAGTLARTGAFAALAYLIAGFNIFIGVANLLPLPPLDGGHLAVLGYEKVTGRDVDMRKLIPVAAAVISIFGSLFLLLLFLDIVRPLPPIPG